MAPAQLVAHIIRSLFAVVPDNVISAAIPAVIVVGLIALMIELLVPPGACAIKHAYTYNHTSHTCSQQPLETVSYMKSGVLSCHTHHLLFILANA